MGEKRCSTCHLVRPLSDFNVRRRSKDGRQSRCRVCSAQWYTANKVEHRANVRARNARIRVEYRQRLGDYLLEHPCVDCGESDVRVLEFDHENPDEKLDEVVRLTAYGVSWDRIEAEIAKCSVRCANCHRRRTAEMFGYWRDEVESDRRAGLAERVHGRLVRILGAPAYPLRVRQV